MRPTGAWTNKQTVLADFSILGWDRGKGDHQL